MQKKKKTAAITTPPEAQLNGITDFKVNSNSAVPAVEKKSPDVLPLSDDAKTVDVEESINANENGEGKISGNKTDV